MEPSVSSDEKVEEICLVLIFPAVMWSKDIEKYLQQYNRAYHRFWHVQKTDK